jgi:hypothetical protein
VRELRNHIFVAITQEWHKRSGEQTQYLKHHISEVTLKNCIILDKKQQQL